MLKEFEFYHGVVLSRLVHGNIPVRIHSYSPETNASYVLNDSVGLYIKHSTKRMSPWRFTFMEYHQDEIQEMRDKFPELFVVLVCGHDGLVALSFDELKQLLDETHEIEWIAAARRPREKYTVTGSNGDLNYKIGDNEFPSKVIASLRGYPR